MNNEIILDELPEYVGVYKKTGHCCYHNTARHGWGVSVDVKKKELVFGTWVPVGAIILRESVQNNEDVVRLLTNAQDVIAYKKSKKSKK